MQIFVTSPDPIACAKYLDNRRMVKMVLESAQLLSTAMHLKKLKGPYRPTHIHHPCTKWAAADMRNYYWLYRHFKALCSEYTARYNKTHKCAELGSIFKSVLPSPLPGDPLYFVNCTTNHKHLGDVYKAYQQELFYKWSRDKHPPVIHLSTIRPHNPL